MKATFRPQRNKKLFENHSSMQVTSISPSLNSSLSQYLQLVNPNRTLGPASFEGEDVALPLVIQSPVLVVEDAMPQFEYPSCTNRNLSLFPPTLLYTGRPALHRPASGL